MRKLILISVCLLSISPWAQAALFDDKEARQWIQDLKEKTDAQNQATQASIEALKKSEQALEARIVSVENVIKSQGLMDLINQIDALNQELSNVKGQLEVAQHDLELSAQRQKDLYADTDSRLRKLEGAATQAELPPTQENGVPATKLAESSAASADVKSDDSPEAKAFDNAQSLLRAGKYKEAFDAFDKFIQSYSSSKQLPEAQYSLGFSQFSLKNYKAAIATQQKLITQFPENAKVPDAKYNIANCQIQLSDIDGAKKTLRDLIAQHPNSELIPNAKRRLTVLESIKK
jgi:tol-pal system protein YbgF